MPQNTATQNITPAAARTFGVELEAYGTSTGYTTNFREQYRLVKETNVPLNPSVAYNDRDITKWKVTLDASVYDGRGTSPYSGGTGFEVVSRVLQGNDGFDELETVVDALKDGGCKVNKTCGIHVHIGVSDLNFEQIKNIFVRYEKFEREFDAIMPRSRRGNSNSLVSSLRGRLNASARGCRELTCGDRYFKLNPMSYLKYKTLEFRHHGGSLNATKIKNWIKFCQQFVNASVEAASHTATVDTAAQNTAIALRVLTERENYVLGRFQMFGSLTAANIAAECNCSESVATNIVSAIRRGGHVITCSRGVYTYQGESAAVTVNQMARPAARGNDTFFAGIESRLENYFTRRRRRLAAA